MIFTATIAEILHTKGPAKFAALVAQLIEAGLLKPAAAAGDSWFRPVEASAARRSEPEPAEHAA